MTGSRYSSALTSAVVVSVAGDDDSVCSLASKLLSYAGVVVTEPWLWLVASGLLIFDVPALEHSQVLSGPALQSHFVLAPQVAGAHNRAQMARGNIFIFPDTLFVLYYSSGLMPTWRVRSQASELPPNISKEG